MVALAANAECNTTAAFPLGTQTAREAKFLQDPVEIGTLGAASRYPGPPEIISGSNDKVSVQQPAFGQSCSTGMKAPNAQMHSILIMSAAF